MKLQSVDYIVINEYEKKLGGFRPHFQGKPDNYYELSVLDILSGISLCIFLVIVIFILAVGLFFWSSTVSTSNLIQVWGIVLCVFIPFLMIVAYCGSRGKIEIEERLVKEALKKQVQEKEAREKLRQKNKENESNNLKKVSLEKSAEKLIDLHH